MQHIILFQSHCEILLHLQQIFPVFLPLQDVTKSIDLKSLLISVDDDIQKHLIKKYIQGIDQNRGQC
jgi:hypothetical protein